MRILIVNDDGIDAEGIHILAETAKELGEVWVVAPEKQCSAMSQCITVRRDITIRKKEIPVKGVRSYSVSGTPADCVKIALLHIMPQKPDIVFSGINFGYNAGHDILYSGTVGAAVEALANGIPAIAFSCEDNGIYDVVRKHLLPIASRLMGSALPSDTLWNVNFPGCSMEEYQGILENRIPADHQLYQDYYHEKERKGDSLVLHAGGVMAEEAAEGTDIKALLDRYISIGTVTSSVLSSARTL